VPAYQYFIAQRALEAYVTANETEQSRLLKAFDVLSRDPESGVHVVQISQSRELSGRWFGNWLIVYYLDHPIRTVVIVDCQWM
jgi:plasmid stabilization system protein ParE